MAMSIVRRLYFYVAAFIGQHLLAAGARDLLSTLLERLLAPPALGSAEQAVNRLSASAALLMMYTDIIAREDREDTKRAPWPV